jgi:hypothetical protein
MTHLKRVKTIDGDKKVVVAMRKLAGWPII